MHSCQNLAVKAAVPMLRSCQHWPTAEVHLLSRSRHQHQHPGVMYEVTALFRFCLSVPGPDLLHSQHRLQPACLSH